MNQIYLENENKSFTDTTVQALSVLMLQGKQLVKRLPQDTKNTSFSHTTVHTFCVPMLQVRQLVKTVLPFHAMGFKNHRAVPAGAAPGLKVLEGCARVLLQTIYLEGYSLGLEVRVEVMPKASFV